MAHSQQTFNVVREAYLSGVGTLAEIAERHHVSVDTIKSWRKRYGWALRLPNKSSIVRSVRG